jgi:hypothetical protein
MVAAPPRKEEFKPIADILSQFGFIYLKGASLIFTVFNDERTGTKKRK